MRNQLLRDTDWASMAHSLEVRVPLVDSVLLAGRWLPLDNDSGLAADGKRLLAHHQCVRCLRPSFIVAPKTGFTTPIERWMQVTLKRGRSRSCTHASTQ